MSEPLTTPEELTIALLHIREQIARLAEGDHQLRIDTLRHESEAIAASFTDPKWSEEEHPHGNV